MFFNKMEKFTLELVVDMLNTKHADITSSIDRRLIGLSITGPQQITESDNSTFSVKLHMRKTGITTSVNYMVMDSFSLTLNSHNIYEMVKSTTPEYNRITVLTEAIRIFPIMINKYISFVENHPVEFSSIVRFGRTIDFTKKELSTAEVILLDEFSEYLQSFPNISKFDEAIKHLIRNNVLSGLNYNTKVDNKILKSLLLR